MREESFCVLSPSNYTGAQVIRMGPNLLTSYEPKALDPTASFTIITHSFIHPAQGLPAAIVLQPQGLTLER